MPHGVLISSDSCWTIVRMSLLYGSRQIAAYTGISLRSVQRVISCWRQSGSPFNRRARLGRMPLLDLADIRLLQNLLLANADSYLDELQTLLQDAHGKHVSITTIWRALNITGYSRKKLTRYARERNEEKRANFLHELGRDFPDYRRYVFVDESSVNRRTASRIYGYSLRNHRAYGSYHFVRGRRYSILPAITINGIVHLKIVEGSFNSESFRAFIRDLLDILDPAQDVIIMDNCSIHKSRETLDMITDRGFSYKYLPPYSPDYNPIELAFSAIKAHIRRYRDTFLQIIEWMERSGNDELMRLFLYDAVFSVTASDARGFFKHCGYF